VITYDSKRVDEMNTEVAPGAAFPEPAPEPENGVRWVNVTGMQEDGGNTLFLVIRMISWNGEQRTLETEQVSIFSVGRSVISFQERHGDVLEGVRERIRAGKGRVRRSPGDYLVYAILDAVVDSTFLAVEELLSRVHRLRGEVITLRRGVWPLREMLQLPSKGQNEFFNVETLPFLQDTYDHVLALIDTIDAQRDRVTGLFQLHSSMVGASTNEVMRTLTIIATIFIPLTFVAGMVYYFRKRRWF